MTREEAIAILEEVKVIDDSMYQYNPAYLESLDMAIEVLKKEIPKPISIENGFVKCGRCGMYIRFPIADNYNNCPECGQKILWKGDTE